MLYALLIWLLLVPPNPGTLAPAAVCTCATAAVSNGWCEAHAVGQVGGIRIPSQLLYETLDAHGHDVDLSTFECPSCRAAIAASGFCAEHRIGFVKEQAYFSRLTYELARAEVRDPARLACPFCRKNSETWGWCDTHGVGMMGRFAAADRTGYEAAAAAAAILRLAIAELPRCELCAMAMVTDSQCPRCRITYKDGRPIP